MISQACGQTSDARTSESAVAPTKTIASSTVNRRKAGASGPIANSSINSDVCQLIEITIGSNPLQTACSSPADRNLAWTTPEVIPVHHFHCNSNCRSDF